MNKTFKALSAVLAFSTLAACGSSSASTAFASSSAAASSDTAAVSSEPLQIAIPDDATNGARAIKLLESAGLIEVDPAAGYSPELKDITKYLYNIEIVPQSAETLPQSLDDLGAATINGTYAIPAGLNPERDGLIIEDQGESGDNPYVNVIVARTADKDNETYKTIVEAYQTQYVADYLLGKYQDTYYPAFDYDKDEAEANKDKVVEEVDSYESGSDGKTVVTVGVCGANNEQWKAVQKVLDDENAGIYIELQQFDSYDVPNDALNAGDIDLNSFQHKAYLQSEIDAAGYDITAIGDTLIAPLTLYSRKASTLDELKTLAGKLD